MSSRPILIPPRGLPAGVETGPLGRRFAAQLIDAVVPAVLITLTLVVGGSAGGGAGVAVSVIGWLLVAGWLIVVWWMFATKAAGPGMRVMKLQLVGLRDGRPIGWGRFFIRSLVLMALTASVIGLLLMLYFLFQHPRKQGWHDLVALSVVIKERALAPARSARHPAATGSAALAAPADRSAGSTKAPRKAVPARKGTPSAAPVKKVSAAPPRTRRTRGSNPPKKAVPTPPAVKSVGVPVTPVPTAGPVAPPAVSPTPVESEPLAPVAPLESPMLTEDSIQFSRTPSVPVAGPDAVAVASAEPGSAGATSEDAPQDTGWTIELDDERQVSVSGLVLLGRNPQPRPGEEDAQLIKIADETRTVSKTHFAIGVDVRGLYVMDRGSTNGLTLTNAAGISKPCPPGEVVSASAGSIVSFGDHWLRIERSAGR